LIDTAYTGDDGRAGAGFVVNIDNSTAISAEMQIGEGNVTFALAAKLSTDEQRENSRYKIVVEISLKI
jgi:hypothetical protein